ncbi:MAG: hypothetical protein EXS52_00095 [Candidatus Staskawiczbacteria bacterium]|nr:hypothetical protein [Candidatus Staskawiczbacteria bacterium]
MKLHNNIILLSILLLLFAPPALAAEMFFGTNAQKLGTDQSVEVGVLINPEKDSINALEGTVSFPDSLLELREIRKGNSIISFWIEEPFLDKGGSVRFSGVIPGGLAQSNGYLFSMIFQTKGPGKARINIGQGKALLNDGSGSEAPFRSSFTELTIASGLQSPGVLPVYDPRAPEAFKSEISQSPDLFDGKWFLVFATQDKGSGISRYEIREGTLGDFSIAQSPYLLQNQRVNEKIFIKAVDKNGNERLEIFYPPNWRPWYKQYWIFGILILGLCIVGWFIGRKFFVK